MSRRGGRREAPRLLSTHDLEVRRAVWRRRRVRRRAAWSVLLLFAVAAAAVIVVVSGSSSHRPSDRTTLASRVPVAGLDRTVRDRAQRSALSVSASVVAPIEWVLSYTSYVRVGTRASAMWR